MRPLSIVAPQWWDYTTLDREILDEAARLSVDDLLGLSRDGFTVKSYDTIEDFYLAEALEYVTAWPIRPCRCRCWPIIRAFSLTFIDRGSGRAKWKCTREKSEILSTKS